MTETFDYDVALSFAGEDRQKVESLACRLKQQNVQVFYDRDKQSAIWGENLQEYLTDVYLKQARFCVMFISRAYAEKMWTRQERRAAMARAMQEKRAYILPIRLDGTDLEALLPTIAYITFSEHTEDEILRMILEKLDASRGGSRTPAQTDRSFSIAMPKIRKTFTQREKDVFTRQAFETIRLYFGQELQQLQKRDSDVQSELESVHSAMFLCRVYVKEGPAKACKIWATTWPHSSDHRICYYEERNICRDEDNPTAEMLSVANKGHQLSLEASSGMPFRWPPGAEEGLVSPQRAAEILWQHFTKSLSVD